MRLAIVLLLIATLDLAAQEPDGGKSPVPAGASVIRNLEYAKAGGKPLLLDLYRPEKAPVKALPVVVWVHGGGWTKGSKSGARPAAWLAAEGYAVASIDYRLATEAQWPAQMEDCHAAVRWLRQNAVKYQLDPARFAAFGGSAGGHLAALMGTLPAAPNERVQAAIIHYGPSDLLTMPGNVLSATHTRDDLAKSNGALLLGGIVMDQPEKAKAASAIYQITRDTPPFLLMHGDADKAVPLEQSVKFHAALERAGVKSALHILPGAGHAGPEFNSAESHKIITDFLAEHLLK